MNACLKDGALAGLLDDGVHLAAGTLNGLLNARGMNAPVGNELFQRQARDLAANGIKRGQGNCLRHIVDNEIDSGHGLDGADIASLAADDAPFHFIAGQIHHRDGRLADKICAHTLNGLRDDQFCFVVCFFLDLLFQCDDALCGIQLCISLNAGNQLRFCLLCGIAGHSFQKIQLALTHALQFGGSVGVFFHLFVQGFVLAVDRLMLFIQRFLFLHKAPFLLVQLVAALAQLPLGLVLRAQDFFLCLDQRFLLLLFTLLFRSLDNALGFLFGRADLCLRNAAAQNDAEQNTEPEANDSGNQGRNNHKCGLLHDVSPCFLKVFGFA